LSVFVDTTAIYAGIAANDEFHEAAVRAWTRLFGERETLLTHSLVEVEAVTLLQTRIGIGAVEAMSDALLPQIQVVEVDRVERRAALAALVAGRQRGVSIVDRVSFNLMKVLGLRTAFTFDRDFAVAGFEVVGP
jgi:predicted nucleic acid-binding protein